MIEDMSPDTAAETILPNDQSRERFAGGLVPLG